MPIQARVPWSAVLTAAITLVGSPGDAQRIAHGRWDILEVVGQHIPRFESGYVKVGERFYLVGGRQAPQPVEVCDWRRLADAPRPRDHFQAVVLDGKMYAVGGRRSAAASGHALDLTIPEVDVYDFASGRWSTLPATANLPTQRAGASTVVLNGMIIVLGGESAADFRMHTEVEALNLGTMLWTTLAPLIHGRHGTGAVVHEGKIYVAAGSTRQGTGDKVQEVFTPGR